MACSLTTRGRALNLLSTASPKLLPSTRPPSLLSIASAPLSPSSSATLEEVPSIARATSSLANSRNSRLPRCARGRESTRDRSSLTFASRRWSRICELGLQLGGRVSLTALFILSLQHHPVHLDPPSLLAFRHAFSETDKLAYLGVPDDGEPLLSSSAEELT